jgi:hypothetical protein
MKIYKIPFFSIALLLVGCQADEPQPTQQQAGTLSFTTSVQQFDGEASTRVNLSGNGFEPGDKFKIKIVCPFSEHTELGESTYGGSFDAFYLLKWHADSLATLTSDDHCDIDGDYTDSNSPDIYSRFLAQPTPYVFTAQTWSQEQVFVDSKSTRVEQYSNVFHANQSKEADYKASDLLWAQTIMQTGTYRVHFNFKHVMSALLIKVVGDISSNAVLTIDNMLDINQAEVIVGDYYAAKSKINTAVDKQYDYSYKSKSSCDIGDNGKALGITVINDEKRTATCKLFKDITQKTTYTAYKDVKNTYRLIIPPYAINNATIMLRDGDKRYNMALNIDDVQPGTLYQITMTLK